MIPVFCPYLFSSDVTETVGGTGIKLTPLPQESDEDAEHHEQDHAYGQRDPQKNRLGARCRDAGRQSAQNGNEGAENCDDGDDRFFIGDTHGHFFLQKS